MISQNSSTEKSGHAETRDRVSLAARLGLVEQGVIDGKSQRQIARELGCDEGTVRRDLEILALPEDQVLAIRNGDSAEKYLRARRRQEAAERLRLRQQQIAAEQRTRLQEEKTSGIHSDETSKAVLDWLGSKELLPPDEERILEMVDRWSWRARDQQEFPCSDPKEVFLICEHGSPPADMIERLNVYVTILTSALLLLAPELAIRDSAIKKASIAVCHPKRWRRR